MDDRLIDTIGASQGLTESGFVKISSRINNATQSPDEKNRKRLTDRRAGPDGAEPVVRSFVRASLCPPVRPVSLA